jgi:hypothetical protein
MFSQQIMDINNTTFGYSSDVYQDEVNRLRPILPNLKVSIADLDDLGQLTPPAVDAEGPWTYRISVRYTNGVRVGITLTDKSTGLSVCTEIAHSIGCPVSYVRLLKKTGEYVADDEAPPTDGFFVDSWVANTPQPKVFKDYPNATRKLIMEAYRIHRDYVCCGTHVEECDPRDGSPDYILHYIHKSKYHDKLGPWEYDLEFWLRDELYHWISCGAETVFNIVFPGHTYTESSYGPPHPEEQSYHYSYNPWSDAEPDSWADEVTAKPEDETEDDDLDKCFDIYDDIPLNVRPAASKSRAVYSGKHIRQQEINQILAHSVQPIKPVKKVAAPVKTGTKSKQAASSWSHMRR